jgi:hypothetical protein
MGRVYFWNDFVENVMHDRIQLVGITVSGVLNNCLKQFVKHLSEFLRVPLHSIVLLLTSLYPLISDPNLKDSVMRTSCSLLEWLPT